MTYRYQGKCSCGWYGPWRNVDSDARTDITKHCKETGTCDPPEANDESLMPHERLRGKVKK